jgi:hypothetical protein
MSYCDELLWIDLQIAAARGETCRTCAHRQSSPKGGMPACRKGCEPACIDDNCTLWARSKFSPATAPTAA